MMAPANDSRLPSASGNSNTKANAAGSGLPRAPSPELPNQGGKLSAWGAGITSLKPSKIAQPPSPRGVPVASPRSSQLSCLSAKPSKPENGQQAAENASTLEAGSCGSSSHQGSTLLGDNNPSAHEGTADSQPATSAAGEATLIPSSALQVQPCNVPQAASQPPLPSQPSSSATEGQGQGQGQGEAHPLSRLDPGPARGLPLDELVAILEGSVVTGAGSKALIAAGAKGADSRQAVKGTSPGQEPVLLVQASLQQMHRFLRTPAEQQALLQLVGTVAAAAVERQCQVQQRRQRSEGVLPGWAISCSLLALALSCGSALLAAWVLFQLWDAAVLPLSL
ncbi:hypothetical protein V8C86DRAFT_3024896 [Haematococcus lacustris]